MPLDLKDDWADGDDYTAAAANAVAAAVNRISDGGAAAFVGTGESTTSTAYADLTTTTDSVTVTIGASGVALVLVSSLLYSDAGGGYAFVSFAVSGANTLAPDDTRKIAYQSAAANYSAEFGRTFLLTGLNAGSTTFKMKYRVLSGTGSYSNRRIAVVPL